MSEGRLERHAAEAASDAVAGEGAGSPESSSPAGWTFLTNHGHALILLARDADLRIRDLASAIGITERTAQTIVGDLVAAGYLHRTRIGRRSRYTVLRDRPFRHPVEREHSVDELLAVLQVPTDDGA